MELNYNELVRSYNEALHNTLRNFKPGPDFLDTWVPDEDPTRCIFGIFEAAAESNEELLTISLDKNVASNLERQWIEKMAAPLGEIQYRKVEDGEKISLRFAKGGALEIGPLYKKALEQYSNRVTHEGHFAQVAPHQILVEVNIEDVSLSCLVNETHEIVGAKHSGATKAVRVLLDQLCADIQGKPFQEATDHGVQKLEFKLRDKLAAKQRGGIITPINSDPAFSLPLRLIREAFKKYQANTGYESTRNFYIEPVTPTFAQLTQEQKIQEIQKALLECCRELNLQEKDLEVVGIRPEVRAVIHCRQDSFKPSFGKAMLKIERMLRERVEPAIELVMESLEDRNKRKERRGESSIMDTVHKVATVQPTEANKGAI